MDRELLLSELIEQLICELERLRYTKPYINRYRTKCKEFSRFVKKTVGEDIFTEEFGAKFLKQVYNYTFGERMQDFSIAEQAAVRTVRRLGEMKQYGVFVRFCEIKEKPDWFNIGVVSS